MELLKLKSNTSFIAIRMNIDLVRVYPYCGEKSEHEANHAFNKS